MATRSALYLFVFVVLLVAAGQTAASFPPAPAAGSPAAVSGAAASTARCALDALTLHTQTLAAAPPGAVAPASGADAVGGQPLDPEPGCLYAADPADQSPAAVVLRFLEASSSGDFAAALALLAPAFSYVDARPSACTALAPCTDPAALARELAADRADRAAPTRVSELWADDASVHARLEQRSWYREAVGVDRTVTVLRAEVRDGKITSYVGTADLSDELTRNFEAFHTGWTPELLALAQSPASQASEPSVAVPTNEPPPAQPCLPLVQGWERTGGGVAARVSNPCGVEHVFGLGAVLYDAEDGRPVGTTREAVWLAPEGETRTVFLPGGTAGAGWGWAAFLPTAAPPDGRQASLCLDVGAGRCLVTDSWLHGTVRALQGVAAGPPLLRAAAEGQVALRWGAAPIDAIGFYDLDFREVILDRVRLAGASAWERAAVLAHELQHAADHSAGRSFARGTECLEREADAAHVQGEVWLQLWQRRLPVAAAAHERDLNGIALAASVGRQRFIRKLAPHYQRSCGNAR